MSQQNPVSKVQAVSQDDLDGIHLSLCSLCRPRPAAREGRCQEQSGDDKTADKCRRNDAGKVPANRALFRRRVHVAFFLLQIRDSIPLLDITEALGRAIARDEENTITPILDGPHPLTRTRRHRRPRPQAETEGRKGKQPDGSANTREAKIAAVWSAEARDLDGNPLKDPGSVSYNAAECLAGYLASKVSTALSAFLRPSAIQIWCRSRVAFRYRDFGNMYSTFAVLWTQQRWPRVLGKPRPAPSNEPSPDFSYCH